MKAHEHQPAAVLMAVHRNDAPVYFAIALDSLAAQDCEPKARLYLYADGPLTAELDALLDARASQIHLLLRGDESRGLAYGLNCLISRLEDEEFAFRMDADDISLPTRFSRQISYLREHPDIDVVGTQVLDIDSDGKVIGERACPVSPEDCAAALVSVIPLVHPSMCFRTRIFHELGIRYPLSYLTEDLALFALLSRRGIRFANVDEPLLCWRQGPALMGRRRSARRGWLELKLYSSVIRDRHGLFSPLYALALARFLLRILPVGLAGLIRGSGARERVIAALTRRHTAGTATSPHKKQAPTARQHPSNP